MCRYDLADDGQPEPCSFGSTGKKWLEHLTLSSEIQADTIVDDLYANAGDILTQIQVRANANFPLPCPCLDAGLDRIGNQVGDRLLQTMRIAVESRQGQLVPDLKPNVVSLYFLLTKQYGPVDNFANGEPLPIENSGLGV